MQSDNFSENSKEQNNENDIEQKLKQLEQDLDNKSVEGLSMSGPSDESVKSNNFNNPNFVNDLYYFFGLGLIGFAVLVFFQHVHIGTGFLQVLGLGSGGFGLLLIPLLVGIALVVYNAQNKIGYGIIAITCALIFYTVLSSLIMTFAPISLVGLIIMLAPLAIGLSLVVKRLGGPKVIEFKMRQEGIIKGYINSKSNKL